MLEKAEDYSLEYDEDSPQLTQEQLSEFRPVNFATMEERAQAMREAGVFDPDDVEQTETVLETAGYK